MSSLYQYIFGYCFTGAGSKNNGTTCEMDCPTKEAAEVHALRGQLLGLEDQRTKLASLIGDEPQVQLLNLQARSLSEFLLS